jgi:serine/threonine protein kinase
MHDARWTMDEVSFLPTACCSITQVLFMIAQSCTGCDVAPSEASGCPGSSTFWTTTQIGLFAGFGGLFLALLVAGAVLRHRNRRRMRRMQLSVNRLGETLHAELEAWRIEWSEVSVFEALGQGAVGVVYRGVWRGLDVAVKVLRGEFTLSQDARGDFDGEARMLRSVKHANIVLFHGAGVVPNGAPFLVTELMEVGSLHDVYSRVRLDWATRRRFAFEVADGMELVHRLQRMHRDLKSGNILVTKGRTGLLHCKVADFGMARLVASNPSRALGPAAMRTNVNSSLQDLQDQHMTLAVGTPQWTAPEVLRGQPYSFPADVFSFAIVMWELAAQRLPWETLEASVMMVPSLLRLLEADERPPLGEDWPLMEPLVDLMQECWSLDPAKRPTFLEIKKRLGQRDGGAPAQGSAVDSASTRNVALQLVV